MRVGRPFHSCEPCQPKGEEWNDNDANRRTILISLVAKMQSVRREDIRPDGMVQWDKFMRFGEILAIIPKCQARGAIVPGKSSKTFMTILHNVPVIHDEDVSGGVFIRGALLMCRVYLTGVGCWSLRGRPTSNRMS